MKWYEGSIPSAIQEAKSRNAVFVVYITGPDEMSKNMDETWNDADVVSEVEKQKMVAIRIESQSETSKQFSAIYPIVCVPSVFFIGNVGVPLEITGGYKSPEEFVKIMQKVSVVQKGGAAPTEGATCQDSTAVSGASDNSAPTETVPEAGEQQPSSSQTVEEVSKEEKVKRARELMEQRRIAKAQEEKEKARQEEIDRRKVGQDIKKLNDWKAEKQMKETQDQLKKDREEEKKARERVREQIARDRAERAERYQKDKTAREKVQQEKDRAKETAKQDAAAKETARKSEFSRVQFRLSDGSFVTNQFSSSDVLDTARQFIAQHMGQPATSLSLSTTYPRRLFNDGDMGQTMADLGLAPSAVIMVLPASSRSTQRQGDNSSSQGFFALILAPFLYLWSIICSIFMGGSQPTVQPAPATSQPEPQPGTSQSSNRGTDTRSAYSRNPRNLRQEGNIHRLTDDRGNEDDEDMGTWNGNSTQQM